MKRDLNCSKAGRTRAGFTLVELMVTIAVMAIVLGITVQSLRAFTLRNQVTSTHSSLMASLAFARAEAARRGTAVFVVAAGGAGIGNEYANGWSVYADIDGNGRFTSADLPSLRQHEAIPPAVVVHGASAITFSASGYLTPASAVNLKVCQAQAGTQGYTVTVPPSGISDVSTFNVSSASDCTS